MNYILVLIGAYLSIFDQLQDSPSGQGPLKALAPGQQWNQWKGEHGRLYDSSVDWMKKAIFARNALKVEEFNENQSEELGFELELNHLADVSELEMKEMNGFRLTPQLNSFSLFSGTTRFKNYHRQQAFMERIFANNSIEVPDELDWRKVPGRVSDVKNQGQCGSCWAFASTGVLEGQEANRKERLASSEHREGGKLVELSEQNLVDCVTKDYGCNGGFMADALNFVKEEGGIEDEQSYPYEARTKKCRFRKDKVAFTDSGAAILPAGDEQKLKEMVAKYGPVAVAIDASSIWFQFYRRGVYVNRHCRNKEDQLDHAVLVVGYGTDPKKGDYWIVKNSWGEKYGENGYIRMARNRNNMCGIATVATIATF